MASRAGPRSNTFPVPTVSGATYQQLGQAALTAYSERHLVDIPGVVKPVFGASDRDLGLIRCPKKFTEGEGFTDDRHIIQILTFKLQMMCIALPYLPKPPAERHLKV